MNHVQRFGVFGIAWIVCVFAAYSQLTVSSPDIYKPSVKTDLRVPAVPLHPFRSLCFNDTEPNAAVSKNIKDKQQTQKQMQDKVSEATPIETVLPP